MSFSPKIHGFFLPSQITRSFLHSLGLDDLDSARTRRFIGEFITGVKAGEGDIEGEGDEEEERLRKEVYEVVGGERYRNIMDEYIFGTLRKKSG